MPGNSWRVAIIDSGLGPDLPLAALKACRFADSGSAVSVAPAVPDQLGHGSLMAAIIAGKTAVEVLNAQVFDRTWTTTAACVAAAIDWAVAERAHLLHLSLGLREHRDVLAGAVANAIAAGCVMVVSTPARGEMSYPARYPGVIRATGDARCSPDEISALASRQADFGGCARFGNQRGGGGASVGAAHLTRFVVSHQQAGAGVTQIRSALTAMARYHGPEIRRK